VRSAGGSKETLQNIVRHMRRIGFERLLFGSDAALGGHPSPREVWAGFRAESPLSEAEFRKLAGTVAPYLP
jgi:predicted TIM-barrel fold metal-dependent hydrolase